ncbi:prephenate dehydratase [Sutcliffiella cohnii]|uniref:Prephenate dehydratase n=1 Tax=Sutcliffiella cohnii TaxID=33932 RepID=A0A223KRD2_9BACI|nr:prephenate dehydratase [Sutcliffiella cohnii]AST91883.1 prephenate dehydratase [Sutcliffiella cohnii]
MKKVGYLGPKGTFTEMAAKAVFPNAEGHQYKTIPSSIDGVINEEVDIAVVPLENAIEGSVNLTMDYLLHNVHLPIIGEVIVPIRQHLLGLQKNSGDLEAVRKVYSHPHAIAQCHNFLREQFPHAEIEYTNSTGEAARYIMEHPNELSVAIGNELAAEEYGLQILKHNIHDFENNHTRFIIVSNNTVLTKDHSPLYTKHKTTLMITLPSDYSGALHQVLSAFSWRKLNLSKIESRPTKTGLGNYFFVIDVDHGMDDILIPGVIAELEALQCSVRVLGSYPCYSINMNIIAK